MTFLDALIAAAGTRRRIPLVAAWRAFQQTFPVEAFAGDARERLLHRLRLLASEGHITFPSERGTGWDRSARPALPNWVQRKRAEPDPTEFDPRSVPWAPELGFVMTLSCVDDPGDLLALQAFFAAGGARRIEVPIRERSVEIFGDEKRLDRLLRTQLFAPGRLHLSALRCFAMAPPLVAEDGPRESRGRPALVVENHNTWWSFCRWNSHSGAYASVVYGAGSAFGREAVAFLAERCRALDAPYATYFGDLDPDGLAIPARAAHHFVTAYGRELIPDARWYRLLLRRASVAPLPTAAPLSEASVSWLPESLHRDVLRHFREGRRVPQELVGTELLAREALFESEA